LEVEGIAGKKRKAKMRVASDDSSHAEKGTEDTSNNPTESGETVRLGLAAHAFC